MVEQSARADRGQVTVGLDLGTQSVKAAAVGEDGSVVAWGASPLPDSRADAVKHEQDPEQWWRAVGKACRQVSNALEDEEIAGVATCSTSGTILLADSRGQPVTPALMYDDGRAEDEAELARRAGHDLWRSLGYEMSHSFGLPKLLWLLRSVRESAGTPDVRLLHQADLVSSRLAGEPVATDYSHALKTGYDLLNERWPDEVFKDLGVPVEALPPVVRPGTRIGSVARRAASHCGLPPGTPILAGMTDSCAAQISAGALAEGRWNSVLGTTLALKGSSRELLRDPEGAVYSHRHPDGGWLPGGASNTGAGSLARRFSAAELEALEEQAFDRGPAKTVVYPLTARGERFPFVRPDARGFELRERRDELDLYLAILEGVAFVERLCFRRIEDLGARITGPVALTGGASGSRFWSQLRADVLNRTVFIPYSAEPAVGMAMLARAGTGSVGETAAHMTSVRERFEPDPQRAGQLAENYDRFSQALVERGYISAEFARSAEMP